jgi:hypothetical protein
MRATYVQIVGTAIAVAAAVPRAQADTAPTASGANLCALVSKAEVSRALRVVIVRAEAPDTDLPGCDFSIKGTLAAAGSGHIVDLTKGAAQAKGAQLDDATQKLISNFATGIFQGSDADKSATANARHPGEVPVFTFAILPGDGSDLMGMTRQTHAGIAPTAVTTIPKLGDEAFDSGGAMLNVRKGNRMIQFTYPSCACTVHDVVPLARKIVDQL